MLNCNGCGTAGEVYGILSNVKKLNNEVLSEAL